MSKVLGFRSAKDGASIAIVEMQHCKLSFINREKLIINWFSQNKFSQLKNE